MASRGSVYFRKSDKRWVGKLQLPNDPLSGKKQKPKYVYSSLPGRKGKQEAERKLESLVLKIDSGNLASINKLTVAGWLRKYLDVYCGEREQTTKDGYATYINNHIIPAIGDILLRDCLSIHVENFYRSERSAPRYKMQIKDGKSYPVIKDGKPVPLTKNGKLVVGYSENTILHEHRILNRAFKKAIANNLMIKNPCDGVDAPSPEEYKPANVYDAADYRKLLDKLKGHRLEPIVLTAGMCGLRRAECAGLDWQKSFDFENGILHVEETVVPTSQGNKRKLPKNKTSERDITIPSVIIPRLKQLQGIGPVITRLDGKEYNPKSISSLFHVFLERNNLKQIRFHDLRHFNATMMLESGISDKEAAERLGHSDPTITRKIYQHVLKEMDQKNADKLNSILTPDDHTVPGI